MKTSTAKMRTHLEQSGVEFKQETEDKLHPRRWVSYLDGEEITAKPTLGNCIWASAQELGESE